MSDATLEPKRVRKAKRRALRPLLTPLLLGIIGIPVGIALGLYLQPDYVLYCTVGTTVTGFLVGITPMVMPLLKSMVWNLAMILIPIVGFGAIFGAVHFLYEHNHGDLLAWWSWPMSAGVGGALGFMAWWIGYSAR
ncbi:hypothetical protein CL628_00705 [bacterium]|nr:hypothetical protein [bacterium]